MKKFIAFLLTTLFVIALALPVAACTPKLEAPDIPTIPEIKVKIQLPADFWAKWFREHPIVIGPINPTIPTEPEEPTTPEPTVPETKPPVTELAAPELTDAKYVHGTSTWNKSRLEVTWTAVEGAEYYEVFISKADGEPITYTVTTNSLYKTGVACPRVYIEEDHLWAAAAVMVRAVAGEVYSPWSEQGKIGCNLLH